MRIEHVAFNVADPVAMAAWYEQHLGMRVVRAGPAPANARFLADAAGQGILEIYNNPPDQVPAYGSMDPLLFHIAFQVEDVETATQALLAAGCTTVSAPQTLANGDCFSMLRDPWGLALQPMKRAQPML